MRLNSPASLILGRSAFRDHGSDWTKVREAGRLREDGVIELPPIKATAAPTDSDLDAKPRR